VVNLMVKIADLHGCKCTDLKFTFHYVIDTMPESDEDITTNDLDDLRRRLSGRQHHRLMPFTIGPSITGYNWLKDLKLRIAEMAEKYKDTHILGVGIHCYVSSPRVNYSSANDLVFDDPEVVKSRVLSILESEEEDKEARRKAKPDKNIKGFIVGDIETILVDNIHIPYAMGYVFAGVMGESLERLEKPVTYFTTGNFYDDLGGSFQDLSRAMFENFLSGLISYSKGKGTRKVYFHNLSRFDGILIMKYLLDDKGERWIIKPIIREHNVYQIKVYSKKNPKEVVLDIRDSLKLLPGSLDLLANTMCPELGGKGQLNHEELNEFNISSRRQECLKYLEQDILLLAGILRKAQEKYWVRYQIDITKSLTVSALAMKIYRTYYYPDTLPIYKPQPNQAAFIREGYYGGHTDVYIPYGRDLYYYDVNSLYPYAMTKPMPGGAPVWHSLQGANLSKLFGFVKAKVTCPDDIKVPFLPYRNPETGSLVFPTGTFTGVYFTEELKYAVSIGYSVELQHGYLFSKIDSPFSDFVREIYAERVIAKKDGDEVMSQLHKLTMNSLYGRFGIKPVCNITEICDQEKAESLMSIYKFGPTTPLNDTHYVLSYTASLQGMASHSQISEYAKSRSHWTNSVNDNSTSAVQMSAAVTAYARIHMYPFISLPGCHYTDTDSVVLDKPLEESLVCSKSLGKLKLEFLVSEGYFLAPKCYALALSQDKHIIRFRGAAKSNIDLSWFIEQYKNIGRVIKSSVSSSFKIHWPTLNIYRAQIMLNMGIDPSTKRNLVIDENNRWVDTLPLKIFDKKEKKEE
ncbi:hypothetical protein KP509_1Z195900, partial [Ceratopteris richardii]